MIFMTGADHPPLLQRLRHGLDRIATVLRSDHWAAAERAGLVPAQAFVLTLLAGRGAGGLRVKEIARQLGVSQPSATDSIAALERKGLVIKQSAPGDARAVAVRLTEAGRGAVRALGMATMATDTALAALSDREQQELLLLLIKLIRALQSAGTIPTQRMCATCRYFRPHAHADQSNPHHCDFVNAAFGARDLRLDCSEHETAEPSVQAATWRTLTQGPAALRAEI